MLSLCIYLMPLKHTAVYTGLILLVIMSLLDTGNLTKTLMDNGSNEDDMYTGGHLHSVEISDLPDILTEKCAIIGVPPYPSDFHLEWLLLELTDIFQAEITVFVGQFTSEANTSGQVLWKKNSGSSNIAFYEREPKDRACLLTPSRTKFHALPYTGQLNVNVLVQFINEKCNVFRTPHGTLTPNGLFHEHLMKNLYSPDQQVSQCTELHTMPSRKEFFSDYLFRSRPVVIKNAYRGSSTMKKWSTDYLRQLYGHKHVHIKLTNDGVFEGVESAKLWRGYHDNYIPPEVKSQLEFPDLVVVRPATSEMLFSNFLDLITTGNLSYSAYLEYSSILYYMPEMENDIHELPFLGGQLERRHLNMWLSDGNTLGKLHFDPFDNFLCQLSGEKHLTLFDPHHNENLYESHIPEAILTFDPKTNTFSRDSLLESTSMVMSPVDILDPDFKRFPNFASAQSVQCVLKPGDVLFMPAFWWHEVQSYPDLTERRNLAVNFWYEPVFTKEFPCPHCHLTYNMFYKHFLHEPPS